VNTRGKRIGILTAGGDCPGLNAAIRGVGKTALLEYGMEAIGFSSGFLGLINNEYLELSERNLSGILTLGGTILGTSREKPFKHSGYDEYVASKPDRIKENYRNLKLDALVCIGGNGTMKTAHRLAQEGLDVIGIPKTIDNDVWGTDQTFGFDSAVGIATDAIDRIHTTANSHKRIMVVEIMGHHAGWLTLYAGVAGGADMILIPEIPLNEEVLKEYLEGRIERGKPYTIIAVAEGIGVPEKTSGKPRTSGSARYLAKRIERLTGLEARETILGYIQRGGSPSAMDRILATKLGAHAAHLIADGDFGTMVALKNDEVTHVSLEEVAGKLKTVPADHDLIRYARSLDTCFGDYVD
jgi:phosphofructokinase-like protein